MSGFPAQRKPTLRPGPGSLCTPRPQPLGIRCPLWATAARLCQPRTGLLNSPGSLRATLEPEGGSLSRNGWRNGGASPPPLPTHVLPPSLASRPAPAKSGGFPSDRVSGALFPRAVCVGCLYRPGVCTRRAEVDGFSFTLKKLAQLLPPCLSLLSSCPPPSLPSFLPSFLSFFPRTSLTLFSFFFA